MGESLELYARLTNPAGRLWGKLQRLGGVGPDSGRSRWRTSVELNGKKRIVFSSGSAAVGGERWGELQDEDCGWS
jgi:hypothetical protein